MRASGFATDWRLRGLVAMVATAGAVAAARGDVEHTCVEGDADVSVDGMLDDWGGVTKVRAGGNAADGSFDLFCVYDDKRLALAFNVRDDKVVRVKKGPATEDAIELVLSAGGNPLSVTVMPGAAGQKPKRSLGGKALPKWLAVEDTLQDKGFSIEVVVPLAKLPGYSSGTPAVTAKATFHDSDQATGTATDDVGVDVRLGFAAKVDLLRDFLRAVKAKPADVRFDQQADVDAGHDGKERVVLAGTALGVLADQFSYITLPAQTAADVLEVKLVDLRGDGSRMIAATFRERGNGGSRDLLEVFTVSSGLPTQVVTVEVRKELAGKLLASTWTVAATKVKGKTRRELVVQAGPATGFDADNFDERPAAGIQPINLPWDEDRFGTAFWLEGVDVKTRVIPMPKKQR